MANCASCSAPLPPYADICDYCGSKHDTNFHGIHRYTVNRPLSDRICPHCNEHLQTINLKSAGKFFVERCEKCMGVFFDSGELPALLEKSVSHVYEINLKRIDTINQKNYKKNKTVRYIKCPVCHAFMQRTNFASRSGVIVDKCRDHGIWLDGGELLHLMEWKKSGGEMLHEQLRGGKENASINNRQKTQHENPSIKDKDFLSILWDACSGNSR
ncbi:MAG: zf-TFIIB domain-containing protein [Nitrosomonas sp.]|nr:zf-TFIIB domain-containing protein [Nitrosomonas sp.]